MLIVLIIATALSAMPDMHQTVFVILARSRIDCNVLSTCNYNCRPQSSVTWHDVMLHKHIVRCLQSETSIGFVECLSLHNLRRLWKCTVDPNSNLTEQAKESVACTSYLAESVIGEINNRALKSATLAKTAKSNLPPTMRIFRLLWLTRHYATTEQ